VVTPYKNAERSYEMHFRPLFDWALDQLNHPRLISHFVWDAIKLYKFNGSHWIRFIHEPWTGNNWWTTQVGLVIFSTSSINLYLQSCLPKDAKPLFFILYADKTRLSSFGTEKGYPVIARIANLPVDIRNGEGIGGGQVVGWLPIVSEISCTVYHLTSGQVEEDSSETGKTTFVNHKQIVWHQSFFLLLETIILYSKTGFHHTCADEICHWLFPILLILSADYEEQYVLSLSWQTV